MVRKDIVHGFVNVHCLTRVVPREDSLSSLGDEGFFVFLGPFVLVIVLVLVIKSTEYDYEYEYDHEREE